MAEPQKMVAAVAPDGTPIELPAAELAELQRSATLSGAHAMTPAEEAKARHEIALQQKLDGPEGYIMPGLVGAARGLTFGLSDHALASSPILRDRLHDYEEYDAPAISTGEVAGMVGGSLLGVGAPALAERVGLGAERAGAGILGRGAIEGAMFGAGDAISESALQDHGLTAEALIGGAAQGAIGGAVLSAGAHAVGKSLSNVAEGLDGLASRVFGERVPGVGKAIAEGEAAALGPYRSSDRGIADAVAQRYIDAVPGATSSERAAYAESWSNRERVLQKHTETVETASRDVSTALDEAMSAGRKTDMASFGEAKVNQMSRLVDADKAQQQAVHAFAWMSHADPIVQGLAADVNSSMTKGELKQWNGWMGKLSKAVEERDSLAMNATLDDLKRWVGKQAEFGRGPFGLSKAAKEFDALYQGENGLKGLLENDVWGVRAARAQREINVATSNMLSEGKRFTRKFTTEFGSELGRPTYAADTAAVSGFMGKLTSASNDLDARSFESWVAGRRHYLDAVTRNYTYDAGTTAAIGKERSALEKLAKTYQQTTKDVQLANQVRSALAAERERGIGGALGALIDTSSKPYTTLQRLAQVESQTKGVLKRISGDASSLIGGGSKAANDAPAAKPGKFFSSLLDALSPSRTVASSAGALASRALFAKRAEQIGTLQGNPIAVADHIQKSLSPVETAAPKVTQAATTVALRGLDFLAGKLPPSQRDSFSLQPQFRPSAGGSDAEIARFMRYSEAVDDPLIVLREAKKGTLTPDHVEAVKAVYPKLYDEIRGSVFRSLVESKSELPYQRRIQLGILLELPADKTLAPDFRRAVQATFSVDQAGAESPHQTGAAPNVAGSLQTATQMAMEHAS